MKIVAHVDTDSTLHPQRQEATVIRTIVFSVVFASCSSIALAAAAQSTGEEAPPTDAGVATEVEETPGQKSAVPTLAPAAPQPSALRLYKGVVFDPAGGSVAGATLRVPSLGIEITSSADGVVSFSAPDGEYDIRVEAEGLVPIRDQLSDIIDVFDRFKASRADSWFSKTGLASVHRGSWQSRYSP